MAADADKNDGAGLRERGKRERLRRIKEAAFQAFKAQGYDGASTRDISRAADVSIGTLFVYAKDKRDLLFLVINEDLDMLYLESLAAIPADVGVTEQLVVLLRPIYTYFAKEPELARAVLREMSYMDDSKLGTGLQARRYHDRMRRWREAVIETLAEAGRRGRLKVGSECELLGRALFDVHIITVRDWLQQETPALDEGLASLRALFRAVLGDREIDTLPLQAALTSRDG